MAMTKSQILEEVKDTIGITGNYQDKTLLRHIEEVSAYMASAGVPAAVLVSEKAIGAIARGVSDLWNYGTGGGALSPYFYQRIIQLIYTPSEESGAVYLTDGGDRLMDGAGNYLIDGSEGN